MNKEQLETILLFNKIAVYINAGSVLFLCSLLSRAVFSHSYYEIILDTFLLGITLFSFTIAFLKFKRNKRDLEKLK